jgi:hypothetical protein
MGEGVRGLRRAVDRLVAYAERALRAGDDFGGEPAFAR